MGSSNSERRKVGAGGLLTTELVQHFELSFSESLCPDHTEEIFTRRDFYKFPHL